MNVEMLLRKKGNVIYSIEPDALVYEAIEKMAQENIGALLVIQNGKVQGIISERDYARKVILKGKSSRETSISEVMTTEVCYISKQRRMHECMALMTEKHFRHLPVMDDGELLGLITMGDVVKTIIAEQDHEIEDYQNYIRGGY